ncbi:hypothetical protein [Streptomyces sp. NPDC059783]|uniref:hypothetical protein n=1 Tax=Streptomyces sp. NPDC059783 TaxID=3346944 RepID=UPI0036547994
MSAARSLTRIGAIAGTLSAALMLAVTQASAATAETERATATTYSSGVSWDKCVATSSNQACFSPTGDWFSVYDGNSDGSSAVVDWEAGSRYGAIFNADGYGANRFKNKDFTEGVTVRFRVCKGHWSTKLITAGTCSGWVSISA